jgi:transposase
MVDSGSTDRSEFDLVGYVKSYRPFAPDQIYLLPPSPRDWLPTGHLAYFVLDLVRDLDLSDIERPLQAKDARGERAYSPTMMVSLVLYAYSTGVFSSRRIERATVEDIAFRFLSAGEHPHFTTINGFRGSHREALANLFVQVLQSCMSAGLVKLGHVAIDGTKMKANASKHKAMSFDRMVKDDVRIRAEVEALLARADETDAAEDVEEGTFDPQEEIRLREERLKKMAEVREALRRETAAKRAARLEEQAAELREKATLPSTAPRDQKGFVTLAAIRDQKAKKLKPSPSDDPDDDDSDDDLPRHTPPSTPDGEPKPNAQRNFTDPQSRIMFRDGSFLQAYNAQIAVDEEHQIIVAAALSNQGPDTEYFDPMLRRVVDNCGVPSRVTADAGYFSPSNVKLAESMGTEPFIATGGQRRDGAPDEESRPIAARGTTAQQMNALLQTKAGHSAYAKRKSTVEPVFGQIKSCRGYRQVSFRGLLKSRCEWLLVCATHNLLKLWRSVVGQQLLTA